MKYLLSLLTLIVVFLFMAGCAQTVQNGQPVVTETSAPPVTYTTAPATLPVIMTTGPIYGNVVAIQKMAFVPAQITISTGTMARWVNKDTVAHAVAFLPAYKIDSIVLSPGQAFTVKVDHTGVYNYSDSRYPNMQGAVIVV